MGPTVLYASEVTQEYKIEPINYGRLQPTIPIYVPSSIFFLNLICCDVFQMNYISMLKVYQNSVRWRFFRYTADEATGSWRKFLNKKLCNLYFYCGNEIKEENVAEHR
jgi:hypothetical protein